MISGFKPTHLKTKHLIPSRWALWRDNWHQFSLHLCSCCNLIILWIILAVSHLLGLVGAILSVEYYRGKYNTKKDHSMKPNQSPSSSICRTPFISWLFILYYLLLFLSSCMISSCPWRPCECPVNARKVPFLLSCCLFLPFLLEFCNWGEVTHPHDSKQLISKSTITKKPSIHCLVSRSWYSTMNYERIQVKDFALLPPTLSSFRK